MPVKRCASGVNRETKRKNRVWRRLKRGRLRRSKQRQLGGTLSDDLEEDGGLLEAAGLPLVHGGSSGPIRAHWHDGRKQHGHHVEILLRTPEIEGIYAIVRGASNGWDGKDALRPGRGG